MITVSLVAVEYSSKGILTGSDKKYHSKSEMRRLEHMMNVPQWCSYCQKETKTKEWDCVICGFSKGHPKEKESKDG